MRNRDLMYLDHALKAAAALGIAASRLPASERPGALTGLHSALILAEEARQAMVERCSEADKTQD